MNWISDSQIVDVVLASILLIRLVQLNLHLKYFALFVFVSADCVQSLLYVPFRQYHLLDFRIFSAIVAAITWATTIWAVYALLMSILKQLPGILRFSLWFLNIVFLIWISLSAFLTARHGYAAYDLPQKTTFLPQLAVYVNISTLVFTLAELLVILSILAFILRFPIRVPRNLAIFSSGFCLLLFLDAACLLFVTYVPEFRGYWLATGIPPCLTLLCLLYWISSVNEAGEHAEVTLGREWQSVPKEHLVRQLEAMNAALLRSREQV
jgi:hypothetical protein